MTHLTPVEAKDELYGIVSDAFAVWLVTTAEVCEVRYQGKPNAARTANLFAYLSMKTVLSSFKAFVNIEDGADQRIYETSGLFFAQVNVAKSEHNAFRRGDLISTALRNMVRDVDTPSGIWLRNARYNEIDADAQNYRWNVIAEFEYDEIG